MEALSTLANLGGIAAVLAWLLTQTNPRLDRLERAIDRATRAQMLALINNGRVSGEVRRSAISLFQEAGGHRSEFDTGTGAA